MLMFRNSGSLTGIRLRLRWRGGSDGISSATAPKIDTVEGVLKYVGDEFSAIAKAFNETNILRSRVLHVAPEKPREGMIATADGSNWNPGSGAGTYTYINGAWVLNSSGAGISAAADFVTATAQASLSAGESRYGFGEY